MEFLSGDLSGLKRAYKFAFPYLTLSIVSLEPSELRDFFLKVNEKLEMGGYYFFEFWNRTADSVDLTVRRYKSI